MKVSTLKVEARHSLQGKWRTTIGVTLLFLLIDNIVALAAASFRSDDLSAADLLIAFWDIFVSGPLILGFSSFFLRLCRHQEASTNQLFSHFTNSEAYVKGILSHLLLTIYTLLWTLLLIIPGIIKSFSYAMTRYLLIDHPELSVNQAITKSREMMDGYKMKLFGLYLSFIGWFLLSLLTLGTGFIWLIPYVETAVAQFYLQLSQGKENSPVEESIL